MKDTGESEIFCFCRCFLCYDNTNTGVAVRLQEFRALAGIQCAYETDTVRRKKLHVHRFMDIYIRKSHERGRTKCSSLHRKTSIM